MSFLTGVLLSLPRWWWMPPNAAAHGVPLDHLLRWDLAVMLACLLLAQALLAITLLRRRASSRPGSRKSPSVRLVEGLPLALIALLFAGMTWTAQRLWARSRFEGPSPAALQVEVVGQQFQWYFHYPGPDATYGVSKPTLIDAAGGNPLGLDPADDHARDDLVSSELVLPATREIDLQLRALDVIHGFFIPAMRLKQNAVPGLVFHVHFTPLAPGVYPILCSQVCGLGHARMGARLRVLPPADYARWLAAREKTHLAATQAGAP